MAPRRSEVRLLFCRLNAGHVLVLTMRELSRVFTQASEEEAS